MSILFTGDFYYNQGKKTIIMHDQINNSISRFDAFILNFEGPIFEKIVVA